MQLRKAWLSITVILFDNVTLFRLAQPKNAAFSSFVTLFAIVTVLIDEHWRKVCDFIVVIVSGITKFSTKLLFK